MKKKSSILSHKMNREKLQHFLCSIEPFFSCHFIIWTRKRWEFNNFFIIIAHKEFSPPLSPSRFIRVIKSNIYLMDTLQVYYAAKVWTAMAEYRLPIYTRSTISDPSTHHLAAYNINNFLWCFFNILQKIDKHWRLLKV